MKHVLIIDADKSYRITCTDFLSAKGFCVRGVGSAQAAIGLCEEQKPDVVLLELQLRGHSGVEFLHEFRSYTEWRDVPVVLHTIVPLQGMNRFQESFKTMGITGYFYKPDTTLEKLLNTVESTTEKTL